MFFINLYSQGCGKTDAAAIVRKSDNGEEAAFKGCPHPSPANPLPQTPFSDA